MIKDMTSCDVHGHHEFIKPIYWFQVPAKRMLSIKMPWKQKKEAKRDDHETKVLYLNLNYISTEYVTHIALVVHARSCTTSRAACRMNWCSWAASSLCHTVALDCKIILNWWRKQDPLFSMPRKNKVMQEKYKHLHEYNNINNQALSH